MTSRVALRSILHRHHASGNGRVLTGRHADRYDRVVAGWLLVPLYRAVAAHVAAAVPEGGRVLDVGTGPGRLLVDLAARRPDLHLVGVDPSPEMVAHARRRSRDAGLVDRLEVARGVAESLPFADASFDAVTSTLAAHHWSDVGAAIAEQVRVVRPGGRLWICDLRASARTVEAALAAERPSASVARPRLGRVAAAVVACRQVTKPAGSAVAG